MCHFSVSSQDSPDEVISCAPDILPQSECGANHMTGLPESGRDTQGHGSSRSPAPTTIHGAALQTRLRASRRPWKPLTGWSCFTMKPRDSQECLPSIFHKINVIPQGVAPYAGLSERTELRIREGFGKEDICFLMVASVDPSRTFPQP